MASLISKFNLIERIKAIKDLILQVLDRISAQLGIITSRLEGIETTTNSSLENEGSLLQASIYLVETLQQQTQIRQEQQNQILQQLGILQQQSQIHDQILQQTQALQQQQNQIQQQQNQIQQQQNQIQQQIEALQQQTGVILTTEQYSLLNPEVGLMTYLYSYLPSRTALDIGANAGEVSECLLQSGYEVYAFEPFSPVFDKLSDRLSKYVGFHPYNFAVGATDGTMDLHIAEDISEADKYKDSSLFNSLARHSMPEDLKFGSTVPVLVRSLETLHRSLEIPDNVGLVKIDTEGFDIEVIRGMGEYRYSVVVTEFWDSNIPFGKSGAKNKLEEQVKEMKQRDYHWYIVVYRIWGGSYGAAFYCNHSQAVDNSWGNIFFFQNYDVFAQALKWCSAVLPTTYFNS